MHFPEAAVASEHRPHLVHHGDLHLKLKVLVLPLSAEEVARDANFDWLLSTVRVCRKRTRDEVLQQKSTKREKKKDTRGKMAESKVLTWKQMKEKIKNQFYLSKG